MRMGLYRPRRVLRPKQKRQFLCFIILLIVVSALGLLLNFYLRIEPVYCERAAQYAEETAAFAVNQAAAQVFLDKKTEDIFIGTENNDMYRADTAKLNSLKAELDQAIRQELEKKEDGWIQMPIGSMFSQNVFAATGPKISLKVHTTSVVKLDFQETFTAAGINQVQHKIDLVANIQMYIISAGMHIEKTVSHQIPVTETILSGQIPNYYAGNQSQIPAINYK